MRKKRMPQRFARCKALIGVQRQAALEEVHKVVQLPRLGIAHAARCRQQAGAQIPRRRDHSHGFDVGL